MRAGILHALPLAVPVTPQDQVLAQQLQRVWAGGVEGIQHMHGVPVAGPPEAIQAVLWCAAGAAARGCLLGCLGPRLLLLLTGADGPAGEQRANQHWLRTGEQPDTFLLLTRVIVF